MILVGDSSLSNTPLVASLLAGILLMISPGALAAWVTRLTDRPGLSDWIQVPSERGWRIAVRVLALALIVIPLLIAYFQGPGF